MRTFNTIFLAFLLVTFTAWSAEKRALTIEDFYKIKPISDIQISPDGKSVLYVIETMDLSRAKQTRHVWMMRIDGRDAYQLTESVQGEDSPRFSPDPKWISFISSRDGKPNLYLMPANGGEGRQLTRLSTGVADPLWSPDGKYIAFASNVYPECGADDACNKKIGERWQSGALRAHSADSLLYRHWTSWKEGTRSHILLAKVETGEITDLTPGDFDSPAFQLSGSPQYDFSPNGKQFVYVSNHDRDPESSTNNDLWVMSLEDKTPAPRNITHANPAYDGSPEYSPDGRFIAYRMQKIPRYESDLFRLALYDTSNGSSVVLTEEFRNWIDDFKWAKDSRAIYFAGPVEGQTPIYRLDLDSRKITELLTDATINEFTFTPDQQTIVYARHSVGDPVEIYRGDVNSGRIAKASRLTLVNRAITEEVDIRPAESIWVEGAGGARIQVFIVKPHGFDPARKYPLILNVHGGPQMQWADGFRGDWQVYPGAGYVVAFANPHGSTGRGQEFTAEISGDWGGEVFEDLMKVTDALEKLPYVDRERMGAMGWSYGGYMMNWFEGHTQRFKAIASMMGLYDLKSFYGATEELWFPEWDLKGEPWNSDLYQKWSPDQYVKNFKTPCLVISGELDYRVPYTQSLEFFTALQKMRVPSKLVVFSRAGHWPSWYEMALYYTVHLEWFQKYLGGQAPPWRYEKFLRNAVFDTTTGQRITE